MRFVKHDSDGTIFRVMNVSEIEPYSGDPRCILVLPELDSVKSQALISNYWVNEGQIVEKPEFPGAGAVWKQGAWHITTERIYEMARKRRENELWASDWTQLPDSALSTEQKQAWATYRQALRDVPSQVVTRYEEFIWPTEPS